MKHNAFMLWANTSRSSALKVYSCLWRRTCGIWSKKKPKCGNKVDILLTNDAVGCVEYLTHCMRPFFDFMNIFVRFQLKGRRTVCRKNHKTHSLEQHYFKMCFNFKRLIFVLVFCLELIFLRNFLGCSKSLMDKIYQISLEIYSFMQTGLSFKHTFINEFQAFFLKSLPIIFEQLRFINLLL